MMTITPVRRLFIFVQRSLTSTACGDSPARLHCNPSCSMLTARPPSTDHIDHSQMFNARSSGERDDPQAQGPEASRSEWRAFARFQESLSASARERLGRLADGYDSGAQHSQPQHDQQQCGAHSSGVSTSTEDSCRTPNQRPAGGNQDLTEHQRESYEQYIADPSAQWRGETGRYRILGLACEKWDREAASAQGNPLERLSRPADDCDSGTTHSQLRHDQQQCDAHPSGVSTSTVDPCRAPDQRPAVGSQDHTAQQREEPEDDKPHAQRSTDSAAQWHQGTGPYSGMGQAYAPPPPGYAAPAMYLSEQQALGQACAASVGALMSQHHNENGKRWRYRQDLEKAIQMTADRIFTGVRGPMSEHGSRVVKLVLTDKDGLVYCWKQAGSSDDHFGPHVDFPGLEER